MPKITVTVSGDAATEKSTLITALCDFLRERGAAVVMPAALRNFDMQKTGHSIDWSKFDIELKETR